MSESCHRSVVRHVAKNGAAACPTQIFPLLLFVLMLASPSVRAAVMDIQGHPCLFDGKVSAIVFLNPECPISRSEVAALNQIAAASPEAPVVGVISDPTVTREAARKFITDFGVKFT